MISRVIQKTIDLNRIQKVDQLEGPLYQLEDGGHTFEITCLMNGAAAEISGTVSARFLRADETTVYFTGTLSGNVASITLPQSCYNVNGRFGMVIFISGDDVTTAIYAVAGNVYRSTSDTIIDPTEEIPSLEELIAQIEACEDATDAANAAAAGAIGNFAPAYSTSGTYAVGDYVTYNGALYRCSVAISTAESWTAAHWTQVTAAEEIAQAQDSIGDLQGVLYKEVTDPATWHIGNWGTTNGASGTRTDRIRTNSGTIPGLNYLIKSDPGVEFLVLFWTGSTYTTQASYPWRTECDVASIAPSGVTEFRLVARTNPETTLTDVIDQTAAKIHFNVVNKVDKDQGAANAGKSLIVGADGLVTVGDSTIEAAADLSLEQKLYARVTGSGVLKTDGTIATVSGYGTRIQKARIPLGVTSVFVTANMNWDTDKSYCILWFVKNGAMMANGYIAVTTKPQTWTDYEVSVPEGAEEIWFDKLVTVYTSLSLSDNAVARITALENSYNLFVGPFTWTQRVMGLRMLADAQGCYFIPFNALGQGVSRGNGYYGDDYYIDNIHPTELGAYNLALGVWSYLRHIPCWATEMPGTVTAPTLDGSQWSGKKWYAYGTSLTHGTTSTNKYAAFVATMSGLTLTNKGVSGGALVTNRDIYNALLNMEDGKLTADLITIEVGANDSGEMGNPWSLDTSQFFGALNYCIRSMFAAGIKAQVVIMASTPGRYLSTDSSVTFDVNRLYHV